MAEKTIIRIRAAKDAPEFVSHGNAGAENKDGYFETTDRLFAGHIVASGYGEEIVASEEASEPEPEKKETKTGGKK